MADDQGTITPAAAGATPAAEPASTPASASTTPASSAPETVSLADHKRAIDDLHKFKKEAEKYKQTLEADKVARMKEQNQWKELAEQRELQAKEATEKAERLQSSYLGEKKFGALSAAASKLGLRQEAMSDLEMLDLSEIQIETTSTGKINVLGAEKYAERLKTLKPHWFQEKVAPSVNATGQRIQEQPGTVTPAMVLAAQKEGQKSGDMSKYNQLFKQLQMQGRKH